MAIVVHRFSLVALGLLLALVLALSTYTSFTTDNAHAWGICDGVTEIPQVECEALVALYNSTSGSGWANNSNWLQTNTPCDWYGVSCDNGHVTGLSLSSNWLSGSIPAELGNLSRLRYLDLSYNQLSGGIPPELANLSNLERLCLNNNRLSGKLPDLISETNYQYIDFSHNLLTGEIPDSYDEWHLPQLAYLDLSHNPLSGSVGSLPCMGSLQFLNYANTGLCEPCGAECLERFPNSNRTNAACPRSCSVHGWIGCHDAQYGCVRRAIARVDPGGLSARITYFWDYSGSFSFQGLDPGTYTVWISGLDCPVLPSHIIVTMPPSQSYLGFEALPCYTFLPVIQAPPPPTPTPTPTPSKYYWRDGFYSGKGDMNEIVSLRVVENGRKAREGYFKGVCRDWASNNLQFAECTFTQTVTTYDGRTFHFARDLGGGNNPSLVCEYSPEPGITYGCYFYGGNFWTGWCSSIGWIRVRRQ